MMNPDKISAENEKLRKSLEWVCNDVLNLHGVTDLTLYGINASERKYWVKIEFQHSINMAWKILTKYLEVEDVDIKKGKIHLSINNLWTAGLRKSQGVY